METENLPAGLFLGEARMLTIILKGGVETQSLKTTELMKKLISFVINESTIKEIVPTSDDFV